MKHQSLKLGTWLAQGGNFDHVPDEVFPLSTRKAAIEELQQHGYVVVEPTHVGLAVAAKDEIEAFAQKRSLKKYRRDELALQVLDWTDENPDQIASSEALTAAYGEDFTGTFTAPEVDDAAADLERRGYIKGTPVWGGGVARATITPRGEQCLESGLAPNDFEARSGGSTVSSHAPGPSQKNIYNTFNGPVGGVQQGDGNTMQVRQDIRVEAVLDQMRSLVPEGNAEAAQKMADVEAVVRAPEKSPKLLEAAVKAFALALGTEAATTAFGLGETLVKAIFGAS